MAAATPGATTARRKVPVKHKHPVNVIIHDEATLGERVADRISSGIGSWAFLIGQGVIIVIWVTLNVIGLINHWDPYPFILLNLVFSIQAAYTGPVLLLAGNRQAQKDRLRLEHPAEVAETAEKATLTILPELETNTEATLKVLDHLKKRRDARGSAKA